MHGNATLRQKVATAMFDVKYLNGNPLKKSSGPISLKELKNNHQFFSFLRNEIIRNRILLTNAFIVRVNLLIFNKEETITQYNRHNIISYHA